MPGEEAGGAAVAAAPCGGRGPALDWPPRASAFGALFSSASCLVLQAGAAAMPPVAAGLGLSAHDRAEEEGGSWDGPVGATSPSGGGRWPARAAGGGAGEEEADDDSPTRAQASAAAGIILRGFGGVGRVGMGGSCVRLRGVTTTQACMGLRVCEEGRGRPLRHKEKKKDGRVRPQREKTSCAPCVFYPLTPPAHARQTCPLRPCSAAAPAAAAPTRKLPPPSLVARRIAAPRCACTRPPARSATRGPSPSQVS
jgi:hypothetical protein